MTTDADGRVRMEFVLPVRGLIGYRGQLLTDTRGTALLHQIGEGYGPWAGEVTHRTNGVLVADRAGHVERLRPVQPRRSAPSCSSAPGVEVYEGMIVGENSRLGRHGRQPDQGEEAHQHPDPLPRRVAAADAAARRSPSRSAIEFIADDELVEVTPHVDPAAQAPARRSTTDGARPGREDDLRRAVERGDATDQG